MMTLWSSCQVILVLSDESCPHLCISCGPSYLEQYMIKEEYSFSPLLSLKNLDTFITIIHFIVPCYLYIHSINNRTAQWENGISFISFQGASKIFLYSTLDLTHLAVKTKQKVPYLLFRCWMLPKHLKRPFTMMAIRVHSASHSSILLKNSGQVCRINEK